MIAAFAAAAVIGTAQAARIDSIVRTVMHDSAIRGLSLGIARGDSVLYLRGYGSRDARHGADGFTIYAIGSVTKQFTAALVLQNAQAGRLSLDAGSPTVRSLMQQISGDSWQYDNANYAALGALLERTESAPYCVLLAQRILRPQNLFSTACGAPPASENVATSEARYEAPITPAAGGLWSNAFDLVRWLGALRAGRVVSRASFRAMIASGRLSNGSPTGYGFGFFVDDWYGARVVHHEGYWGGYSAMDALVVGDGLAIAILTNAPDVDLVPLAKSLATIVSPPYDRNLYARPGAPPENENPKITAALRKLLETNSYAAYGKLELLEFLERSSRGAATFDRYRATFERAVLSVTVGYGAGDVIESVNVTP